MPVFNWDEDETICDFVVTKERKQLWQIQLELSRELLRVCKKNDIQIFAVCGTLLGAVRHNGFIPWDDDMDYGMDRENYNKLLSVSNEFQQPFFLQHVYTDKYCYSDVMRLRNSNTTAIETKDRKSKCNNGIYLDIFPFDKIPEDAAKLQSLIQQTTLYKKLVYWPRNTAVSKPIDKVKVGVAKVIAGIASYNRLYGLYQNKCQQYNTDKSLKRVGIVSGSASHSEFYYYFDDIEETIDVPFEDILIPIPKGYDRCLTVNYGNYMELPPIEKRGNWHEGMIEIDINTPYKEYQQQHGWLK